MQSESEPFANSWSDGKSGVDHKFLSTLIKLTRCFVTMSTSLTQVNIMSAPTTASRLRFELLEARDVPSRTLFVDDDRAQIPSAAFTSIQAAVDAARRGDDIVVACCHRA